MGGGEEACRGEEEEPPVQGDPEPQGDSAGEAVGTPNSARACGSLQMTLTRLFSGKLEAHELDLGGFKKERSEYNSLEKLCYKDRREIG